MQDLPAETLIIHNIFRFWVKVPTVPQSSLERLESSIEFYEEGKHILLWLLPFWLTKGVFIYRGCLFEVVGGGGEGQGANLRIYGS